jgi:hypothetical protein
MYVQVTAAGLDDRDDCDRLSLADDRIADLASCDHPEGGVIVPVQCDKDDHGSAWIDYDRAISSVG